MRTWSPGLCLLRALAVLAAAVVGSGAAANHYILDCDPWCLPAPTMVDIGPPGAVTTDAAGNVYFSSPSIVFRLGVDGALTRIAGDGIAGFSGDGGPAFAARLSFPDPYPELIDDWMDFYPLVGGLTVDGTGNLFIADAYNNRIRRVDTAGVITTFAGSGTGRADPETDPRFGWVTGLTTGPDGALYVSGGARLSRIAPDGLITELASWNCGYRPPSSGVCVPAGVALHANGNVYVGDAYCRVRAMAPDGQFAMVAGNAEGLCGYSGEGLPATGSKLGQDLPYGIAIDGEGNVYVADAYNACVRKIDGAGIMSTIAGICRQLGFAGDGGPATEARLQNPRGVAVDKAGNVYIADTDNRRIRKVTPDGIITTVAGKDFDFAP